MVKNISLTLKPKARGCHLVTDEVLSQLELPQSGLLQLFIQHTSAALSIQENASPEVLSDLSRALDRLVPEDPSLYQHTEEGPDDMPAHVKAALVGSHVSLPIMNGKVVLGRWQGIYLLEFRNTAGGRTLIASILT